MRYIKGILYHGVLMLMYKIINKNVEVYGYTNFDFSGDQDDRKSNAGYIFMIGGAPISWSSRKQGIVTLSYCEAEYVAASYVTC